MKFLIVLLILVLLCAGCIDNRPRINLTINENCSWEKEAQLELHKIRCYDYGDCEEYNDKINI